MASCRGEDGDHRVGLDAILTTLPRGVATLEGGETMEANSNSFWWSQEGRLSREVWETLSALQGGDYQAQRGGWLTERWALGTDRIVVEIWPLGSFDFYRSGEVAFRKRAVLLTISVGTIRVLDELQKLGLRWREVLGDGATLLAWDGNPPSLRKLA